MSRAWYIYNGADGFPAEGTVGNYSLTTGIPTPTNCAGGTHLCQVYAVYGGDQPFTLSARLKNYFAIAKMNQSSYPVAPNKPYVYTRPS